MRRLVFVCGAKGDGWFSLWGQDEMGFLLVCRW